MATVIDLLRHLGQHAAPDGNNALAGSVTLPAVSPSPLSLPLPPPLLAAWSRVTGRTVLGHHALALSTMQAAQPVVLMGHGSAPHDDLLLLLFAGLIQAPTSTALCLVDDRHYAAKLVALADALRLRWIDPATATGRITHAPLVISTPRDLHRRVLRFHDRAWRWLWPHTTTVALPLLHEYAGGASAHLTWLLRRTIRLMPAPPLLIGSLASVADADTTLARLYEDAVDQPVRVVGAPGLAQQATLVAIWRTGPDRVSAALRLARELAARRLALTVLGENEAETGRLAAQLEAQGIASSSAARVAIVTAIPRSHAARQALLHAGYRLVILLAGDMPHELAFAAQPDLLLDALPPWPIAPHNPYAALAELPCAATERLLEEREIDRWRVRDLRDRLVRKQTLRALPGADLWQNIADPQEVYADLDPRTIGGPAYAVVDPAGATVATLGPAVVDRVAVVGAVWGPGLRIAARDDRQARVQLAEDADQRSTFVVADVRVTVREELASRTVRVGGSTTQLLRGKVAAVQSVRGVIDRKLDGSERRISQPPAELQWATAACWLILPAPPRDPHTTGWAVAQALPLLMLADPSAIVACYDADTQRLYLVEGEPGGGGVIERCYEHIEELLSHAATIAHACAEHPLFAQVATDELAWIDPPAVPATERPVITRTPAAPSPPLHDPRPRIYTARVTMPAASIEPPPAPRDHESARPASGEPRTASATPVPVEQPQASPVIASVAEAATADSDEVVSPQPAVGQREQMEEQPTQPPEQPAVMEHESAARDDQPRTLPGGRIYALPQSAVGPLPRRPEITDQPVEQEVVGTLKSASAQGDAALDDDRTEEVVQDTLRAPTPKPDPQPADAPDEHRQRRWLEELLPEASSEPAKIKEASAHAPETSFDAADAAESAGDLPEPEFRKDPSPPRRPMRYPTRAEASRRFEGRPPRRQPEQDRNEPHYNGERPGQPPRSTPPAPRAIAPRAPRAEPAPRDPQRQPPDPRSQPPDPRSEPPQRPAAEAPQPEREADVNAMIARMRRLREQREAEGTRRTAPTGRIDDDSNQHAVDIRFHIGDRVQCLPYGVGTVQASRIVDGREQLVIAFPEYGEIEVDPTISLVRVLPKRPPVDPNDDLL
jgi:hypothetical protein